MPSSPISPCPSCPPHAAGGHGCAVYSSSVTDAQWAILEPLLPAPGSTAGRGGRPKKHCRRAIVDAILYIVRGGIAWRQLPVEFPPAGTVYAVFARWARSGAWQRILDALRDRLRVRAGRDRCPTAAIIDSQTVPAADTVPRSSRGWDGGKKTNGVKRHIAVDVNGLLLAVVVTAASIPDRDAAHRLLAALRGSFSTIRLVWADGGYPGRLLIWAKDVLTLTMQIIKRIPGATGFHVRPRIWVVEKFRVDQQAPPLRARLRNQTRPPRSHGPPRHDHDHDQATRPNLTVFKHPLGYFVDVGVQRLQQLPRLRCIGVIDHVGIIPSTAKRRAVPLGRPLIESLAGASGHERGCRWVLDVTRPRPSTSALLWQRSRSSLLTSTINSTRIACSRSLNVL